MASFKGSGQDNKQDNKQDYYASISKSHIEGTSNAFVSFMLKMIDLSLDELIKNASIYSNNSIYEKRLLGVMPYEIYLSANEIMGLLGLKSKEALRKNYLNPLIKSKTIVLEFPSKPTSKNQRYKKVK